LNQTEITTTKKAIKDLIFAYAWEQKKNGYSESTITTTTQRLKTLSKICDIREPEQLKETIAKQDWSLRTKKTVTDILNKFVKFLGKTWKQPIYRPPDKLPFIPTEEELDSLISASRKLVACLLQFLKETGARIGEAYQIKWLDIDFERRAVHITPEKHSNARILPLSHQLINMLNRLERKSEYVFKPPSQKAL
jgi:integrase